MFVDLSFVFSPYPKAKAQVLAYSEKQQSHLFPGGFAVLIKWSFNLPGRGQRQNW
jgi:hypothetical protein